MDGGDDDLQLLQHTVLVVERPRARIRFRRILMTTAATVAGHLPLTFASGPGASARNSIGYVLVGGMSIGTPFTLFVVPSLHMLIAWQHRAEQGESLGERGLPGVSG